MKNIALISGASKGIGKAIAVELAQKGYDLHLVARNEMELKEVAQEIMAISPVNVSFSALDLSDLHNISILFETIQTQYGHLDILINNAGYGIWGEFEKLGWMEQQNLLQLNMVSLTKMCHVFLPLLKKSKAAYILNVGSTAAYQAVPTMAVYAASKAYVVSFSRALKYELRNSVVSVTCLSPGPTESAFTSRAGMQAMQAIADKFNMSAKAVAQIGLKALFDGKSEIVPGLVNWLTVFSTYIAPKILVEKVAANLYEKHLK